MKTLPEICSVIPRPMEAFLRESGTDADTIEGEWPERWDRKSKPNSCKKARKSFTDTALSALHDSDR